MKIDDLLYLPRFTGSLAAINSQVRMAVTQTGLGGPLHPLVNPAVGFNLGAHVGDDVGDVQARREALAQWVGAPIVWLQQVHGCEVVDAGQMADTQIQNNPAPQADASLVFGSSRALAIMTADCLPVLFVALSEGRVLGVAAAHAGWRGLHAGVLRVCAGQLAQRCGIRTAHIVAWLGPAIGPASFEVGSEVREAFLQRLPNSCGCFVQGTTAGKYWADLYGLARLDLADAGVSQVQGGGEDTLTDGRWFSHRRSQQKNLPAGRMATIVRLLP
ncbi:peptidoglycan editing factor PgeF [Limnobacter sp.]|uniref:peptidoglycan editing factor PgeF n=1 Tax=Limnobacter sp. TaxID=2003368 RepID=UPI003518750C